MPIGEDSTSRASRWTHLLVPLLLGLGLAAGMLREIVLAYVFGTGPEVEVFRVAYGLPMILSEGLAVSFASALVATLLSHPGQEGRQIATWAVAAIATMMASLGVATMPLQATVLAPGFAAAEHDLVASTGRICWLAMFMLLLSYPLRAVMSTQGKNWPAALGPLLRNGTFIAVLLILASMSRTSALTASVAVVVAAALVLGVYLSIWRAVRLPSPRRRTAFTRPSAHLVLPVVLALLAVTVSQILISGGRILDRMASSLAPQGTLASVEYSYGIIMALASIIATSLNLVLAPRVGRALHAQRVISSRHWRIVGLVIIGSLVTGAVLGALGRPIVALVYERGEFGAESTSTTSLVFSIQALAFGALIASLLLTQLLILLDGHRLLIPVAGVKLAAKAIVLGLLFDTIQPAVAIAVSFCVAEVVFALALGIAIRIQQSRRQGATTN